MNVEKQKETKLQEVIVINFNSTVPITLYYEIEPHTIELALQLTEEFHIDKELHGWLPSTERGEYIAKYANFFLVFRKEDFVGYVCLFEAEGNKQYIHFGSVTKKQLLRNIMASFDIILNYSRRRDIKQIYAESDDKTTQKLAKHMGFKEIENEWVYTLNYGKHTENT